MRFFRQMLIAAKVPELARMAKKAVEEDGMAVVIGLQATGESNTKQAIDDRDGADAGSGEFVSAPHMVLKRLIEKQFPLMAAADTNESRQIPSLHLQVRQSIRSWREAAGGHGPGPAEQSSDDQARAKEVAQSRRRARERAIGFGTGGVSSMSSSSSSSSSAAPATTGFTSAANDDDSDCEMEQARTLDEVLNDKFEIAARTGLIIDLDDGAGDIDEAELEKEDALAEKEREERLEEHKANGRIITSTESGQPSRMSADLMDDLRSDLVVATLIAEETGRGGRASRRSSAPAVNYCEKVGDELTDEDESEEEKEPDEDEDEDEDGEDFDEEDESTEEAGDKTTVKRRKLSYQGSGGGKDSGMGSEDDESDDMGNSDPEDDSRQDTRLRDIRDLLLEGGYRFSQAQ
jgi:hypothetical protein